MSSPKKKMKNKKCSAATSATKPSQSQTLTAMFAKQSNLNKLKLEESDDDDFVQITRVESKSKYFKKRNSEKSKSAEKPDTKKTFNSAPSAAKTRKLSLRRLSSKVKSEGQSSTSSDDTSVVVLSSSPEKDDKGSSKERVKRKLSDSPQTDNGDTDKKPVIKRQKSANLSKKLSSNSSENKEKRSGEGDSNSRNNESCEQILTDKTLKCDAGDESVVMKNEVRENKLNSDVQNSQKSKSKKLNQKTNSKDDSKSKFVKETESSSSQKENIISEVSSTASKLNITESSQGKDTDEENDDEDKKPLDEDGEEEYRVPYYLQNFQTILNSVLEDESYVKLFNDEDMKVIETFNNLSENGQKLYVRLFSRKLQWLNCEKVKYPKISEDLTDVIQELIDVHLVSSEKELTDLEVTLKILSAPDLKALAKSYHVNTSGLQKGQIVDILISKTKQATITSLFGVKGGLTKAMLEKSKKFAGRCIRLKDEERRIFVRILMLFSVVSSSIDEDSANGGQSQLFQMLMVNMGKVVYPNYTVNKQTYIYPDRQHVIMYEKALQYEADLISFTERSKWQEAYEVYLAVKQEHHKLPKSHISFDKKLPDFLRRYTTGSLYVRILSQGIEILQRRKDYKNAVELIEMLLRQPAYCLDYHGYWWERLALNLEVHLKKPLEALEVIKKGMSDKDVRVGHRLALYQRAEKICQINSLKLKHRLTEFEHEEVIEAPKMTIEGRIIPYSVPGIKHKFMTEESYYNGGDAEVTMCNVEQVVLDYYKPDYPDGLHAEGAIVSSLFSLFFWDILFLDIPDAFHSVYQTNPLDKMSLEFYRRRKEEIDERLDWLYNSSIEELNEKSSETWSNYSEMTCSGINWERLQSVEYIQGLIGCIGGKLLSGLLSRYAKDPRHTRSGFPDLTIWNTEHKTFKIVEVKGPGDRLSHKQILWLSYLLKLGINAEVCHVKAVGAKKLKGKT